MMEDLTIYRQIGQRTQGSVYLGVVGPVRTGKSTFIKRFMEQLVIPAIDNEFRRERAMDELPQSASGRTIMTTEPKFIPDEAVTIHLDEKTSFSVRLIDCVGYIVDSALGYIEQNAPRMVQTPWQAAPMPFYQAAEFGTRKVIADHSTIGIVVTCDGTVCDLPREDYEQAEARVISELQQLGKPFVVLLNCRDPESEQAKTLANRLADRYNAVVEPVNCQTMQKGKILQILSAVLMEFPPRCIDFKMPGWARALGRDHWFSMSLRKTVTVAAVSVHHMRDLPAAAAQIGQGEYLAGASITTVDPATGNCTMEIQPNPTLYYGILSEEAGVQITDDAGLVQTLRALRLDAAQYSRVKNALMEVEAKGYGIVTPGIDELTLEEPTIVKQGGRFGVRLRASAPSIHMIRANIETEVSPIVGSERQSEELVEFLMKDFKEDPTAIWQSNFFGRTLHELVNEGLNNKLSRMPDDARFKLQETLQRIINEGSGGLICIIL